MAKSSRKLRRLWERWICPVILLVAASGLITACFWFLRSQPVEPRTGIIAAPLIRTATATQNPAPEKDEAPLSLQPLENWPLPERSSDLSPDTGSMPYTLQPGSPTYLPAFAHPDKGCEWIGVGGQVFGEDGTGRDGLVVFLNGMLDGRPVNLLGITAPQNVFGPGGYEIFLTDRLPEQAHTVELRLFDGKGRALSEAVQIALPTSCEQNLALVNFYSGDANSTTFIPAMHGQP